MIQKYKFLVNSCFFLDILEVTYPYLLINTCYTNHEFDTYTSDLINVVHA